MPRRPRIHVPGGLYHAILRGNHREAIFHRPADYQAFEELVALYLERYEARLHAYCWMPNHVHLAVQVGRAPLGSLMQAVASVYARRKQRCIATTGHLFERRYRAKLVQFDAYLLALVRYIHRNPVRARLVGDPSEYGWSSHRAYLGLARRSWLLTEPTLLLLGGGTCASKHVYRRFMGEEPDPEELTAVRCGQDCSRLRPSDPMPASDFRGPRTVVPRSRTRACSNRDRAARGCRSRGHAGGRRGAPGACPVDTKRAIESPGWQLRLSGAGLER